MKSSKKQSLLKKKNTLCRVSQTNEKYTKFAPIELQVVITSIVNSDLTQSGFSQFSEVSLENS